LSAEQASDLLQIIDTLEMQRQRERELVLQAELDTNAYRALVAAHDALVTTHLAHVTRRAQTEEALHASEERFQMLVEGVEDYALFLLDPQGRVVSWNTGAERILGYGAHEIVGRDYAAFFHPEAIARGEPARQLEVARGAGRSEGEGIRVRSDKSEFWACVVMTALYDERGQLRGFANVLRDVTERKRAEQALRESEARFRVLFEHSPDSVLVIDPHDPGGEWTIVDCNEVACRMNGYTRAELIGHPLDTLHPQRGNAQERAAYLERLRREGTIHLEAIHCRKDGTFFPVDISSSLIELDGRELVLGIDRDITERKRVEEAQRIMAEWSALLQSSLDYRATLQRITRQAVTHLADSCAVTMIEADGSSVFVASDHRDPATDELARKIRERFPFDPNDPHGMAQVLHTGKPLLIEEISDERLQRLAREAAHLEMLRAMDFTSAIVVPLVARGQTLGVLALVSTTSGRRYDERDLKLAEELANRAALAVDNARLYQDAHQALGARDEFLAVAAHELKAPLTTLFGSIRLLQQWIGRDPQTGDRSAQVFALAESAAQHLEKLIDSLLDFARIQSGQLDIDLQPVDLCGLARLVVEQTQPAPNQTLRLSTSAETLIVDGDEMRLELVLHNLLQNAIKYSPGGGTLSVRVTREADQACLEVSDQGIGIPATALGHLFQRFYRASNANQATTGGTGIGLYLVREIVTRHGGEVEARSVEGAGSAFIVRLPLRQNRLSTRERRIRAEQYVEHD
jgi:PAS domain S-box-containing protein